jgi:hypothetical protein
MSRQQRRARARTARPRSYRGWIIGGLAVATAVGLFWYLGSQPVYPRVGHHWHAPFSVVICGERLPPLPLGSGDIHSHGDDIIHIHPARPETAGRNATLAAFLATTPMRITNTTLEIRGQTYTNGDRCSDGRPGRVAVLVNGRQRGDFASYVPQDGDKIEFRFGP